MKQLRNEDTKLNTLYLASEGKNLTGREWIVIRQTTTWKFWLLRNNELLFGSLDVGEELQPNLYFYETSKIIDNNMSQILMDLIE